MGKKYVAGPDVDLDAEVVLDKEGRRIDQAYADRVIAGADAVRPVGRPSLSKTGTSPQIAVRLEAETYARVVELAKSRGVSVAAVARDAVERMVRGA
jgi:hypothetical protein